ncbi:unnamed protein product [Rotaria sp. Silwood2]|nr:unnamed protein product [Rotaria sp. Silwood2]CAF2884643.1 unnamed protein product [Rotaria sp. Silwood2]CAF3150537.1 unnamed protein product [Rotaria sp. Silwood2]CAF4022014.1 unnamed protein product [Rotaria sp. Silwood2]CAF4100100.1 unnamed protein product [Rotaria sp. Silwood2]
MSSDSIQIENTSTTKDLCSSSNIDLDELYSSSRSSSIDFSSSCLSNKDFFESEELSINNRKESTIKLPYPVISDHRDPSSVLALLQKETQTTSKKILDVIQQIENCEKHLTSNNQLDKNKKSLKNERVKLKQQLDALKKHERRINLQIDFITTKVEIKALEDERKQLMNEKNFDENKQINVLLGKLKQKLDKMKIYMRTRNEQMKKIVHGKQRSSTSNDNRQKLSTSQKPQQHHHLTSSDLNQKRSLSSSSTNNSHANKRLKSTNHNQIKVPLVRLTSRLTSHQSQSHSIRTPTVRFLNKTTGSSMTTLNSSSPTTPASSSSTLSPPLIASTSMGDANNIPNSRQIEIPSIDEDDELDLELDIDELFDDDPYCEENIQGFKSETRQIKINPDISKKES